MTPRKIEKPSVADGLRPAKQAGTKVLPEIEAVSVLELDSPEIDERMREAAE